MNTNKAFEMIDALAKECRWRSRNLVHGKNYQAGSKTTISAYSSNTDKPGAIEVAFDPKNISALTGRSQADAANLIAKLQNEVAEFATPKTQYRLPRVSVQSIEQLKAVLDALGEFLGVRESAQNMDDKNSGGDDRNEIDPDSRTLAEILRRRGQAEFRTRLLDAYNSRCALTGCNAVAALEAAHIVPHSEHQSYEPKHGLLLRADIHTLFDLYLLSVDPATGKVVLASELVEAYGDLEGKEAVLPLKAEAMPDPQFLMTHYKRWRRKNVS